MTLREQEKEERDVRCPLCGSEATVRGKTGYAVCRNDRCRKVFP